MVFFFSMPVFASIESGKYSIQSSATLLCGEIFKFTELTNIHLNTEVWTPRSNFRLTEGAPGFFIIKPVDSVDVDLMLTSMNHTSNFQPIETGVVELLDFKRNVVYRSEVVRGELSAINMGNAIYKALEALKQFPFAKVLRYRHTHPPTLLGHEVSFRSWDFSEADMSWDVYIRGKLDKDPNWKHLSLESVVVFLNPILKTVEVERDFVQRELMTKSVSFPSGTHSQR